MKNYQLEKKYFFSTEKISFTPVWLGKSGSKKQLIGHLNKILVRLFFEATLPKPHRFTHKQEMYHVSSPFTFEIT